MNAGEIAEARRQLAEAMKLLYSRGLINIRGGNASIKISETSFLITPSGLPKHNLKPDDMVVVYFDGKWTGKHRPSIEYRMHAEIYKNNPEVKAVVHAHSPLTLIVGEQGFDIEPYEYVEAYYAIGDCVGRIERLPPGSVELAKRVGEEAKKCRVLILLGHGVIAAAKNIYEAIDALEALEDLAKIVLYRKIYSVSK